MTERNYHQVRREVTLMQQIRYAGAVKLLGHFEDGTAMYLVQEICAKVCFCFLFCCVVPVAVGVVCVWGRRCDPLPQTHNNTHDQKPSTN